MKAIILLLVVVAIIVILRHMAWESYTLTYNSADAGAYIIARAPNLLSNPGPGDLSVNAVDSIMTSALTDSDRQSPKAF